MVNRSFEREFLTTQPILATKDPVQAAGYAIDMTSSVVDQATKWGMDAGFALMGTVAFFCLITFLFRKL